MGIIRVLSEFAAAAAVLHPDHRQRYDDLVRADARPAARTKSPAGHADTPETDLSTRRVG